MVAKCVPREIGEHSMILVAIVPIMCENEIRRKRGLQLLEILFNRLAAKREETVSKILNHDLLFGSPFQECAGAQLGLTSTSAACAKNHPENFKFRLILNQL